MAPFDFSSITASPWFAAWQRAAADSMTAAARDPRLMKLGAGLMRSQLLWGRALQTAWQAAWAPIDALADREGSDV
jgi:hypothetical protein